ncbi:hypothetical protein Hanom_Chr04g00315971 [Helianthus anomalus]
MNVVGILTVTVNYKVFLNDFHSLNFCKDKLISELGINRGDNRPEPSTRPEIFYVQTYEIGTFKKVNPTVKFLDPPLVNICEPLPVTRPSLPQRPYRDVLYTCFTRKE